MRYRPPRCQAPLPGTDDRQCGHEMRPLGERHPAFGPGFKPGGWVFECPYCGAARFIESLKAGRYTERIS